MRNLLCAVSVISCTMVPIYSIAAPLYGSYIYSNIETASGVNQYQTSVSPFNGLISDTYTASHGANSAFADASLTTGSVKVRGRGSFTEAYIMDTLYFDISGLTNAFDISFNFHVDGIFGSLGGANYTFALASPLEMSSGTIQYGFAGQSGSTAGGFTQVFDKRGQYSQFGPEDFIGSLSINPLSFSYNVIPVTVLMGLTLSTDADFSHTAQASLTSPIPYTSASGVFLTAPSPVPLPHTVLLFGTALICLSVVSKQKRMSMPANDCP